MKDLHDELESLTELNRIRHEARALRQQAFEATLTLGGSRTEEGGRLEKALLLKALCHPLLPDQIVPKKGGHCDSLKALLIQCFDKPLDDLFADNHKKIPVLLAARSMQALVATSQEAFSTATLRAYYRIVRELYTADSPDWTVGGARAGTGGESSAFITGECIRAILAFERALRRTGIFFQRTVELYTSLEHLRTISCRGLDSMSHWVSSEVERLGLSWFTSIDARLGERALDLELPEPNGAITLEYFQRYMAALPEQLNKTVTEARSNFERALAEVRNHRNEELLSWNQDSGDRSLRQRFVRSESAHQLAEDAVRQAVLRAEDALVEIRSIEGEKDIWEKLGGLKKLSDLFERIAKEVREVTDPSTRYMASVLDRELAAAATNSGGRIIWDARELVFSAAAYGESIDWLDEERLTRACRLLTESISERGIFYSVRPFHSTPGGFRLHAVAFEVCRAFAKLIQKTNTPIDSKLVNRLLYPLKVNRVTHGGVEGWHLENPPLPAKPIAWVTALAFFALDRVVRMLNERINATVLQHFSVKESLPAGSALRLKDLVYPDYGLQSSGERRESIAVTLERVRAHVMRTKLPNRYSREFSFILYGPPGTGKTTLVEALALSSEVPLVEISPSDIAVGGQEAIERRAREIFEALSMLTHATIIFDEFEPVLLKRDPNANDSRSIFTFLTPGMLPKLKKLHDRAEKQGVAYFLVTNLIGSLEPAAIRPGRFDSRIVIDVPDPLSRAGVLLNALTVAGHQAREEHLDALKELVSVSKGETVVNIAKLRGKLEAGTSTDDGLFDLMRQLNKEIREERTVWVERKRASQSLPEKAIADLLDRWEAQLASASSLAEFDRVLANGGRTRRRWWPSRRPPAAGATGAGPGRAPRR